MKQFKWGKAVTAKKKEKIRKSSPPGISPGILSCLEELTGLQPFQGFFEDVSGVSSR